VVLVQLHQLQVQLLNIQVVEVVEVLLTAIQELLAGLVVLVQLVVRELLEHITPQQMHLMVKVVEEVEVLDLELTVVTVL